MRLCLDIGNTRVKAAIFFGKQLMNFYVTRLAKGLRLSSLLREMGLNSFEEVEEVIYASVNYSWDMALFFDISTPKNRINYDQVKLKINYQPVGSMGEDRLALLCAGLDCFEKKSFFIIDIGTCITYDFVYQGEYIGGRISPGFASRFSAMYSNTARLPEILAENFEQVPVFSKSTQSCMQSGAFFGILDEIKGAMDSIAQNYKSVPIVLSGGDAEYFLSLLKKHKSAILFRPYLVLEGLNTLDTKYKFSKREDACKEREY